MDEKKTEKKDQPGPLADPKDHPAEVPRGTQENVPKAEEKVIIVSHDLCVKYLLKLSKYKTYDMVSRRLQRV